MTPRPRRPAKARPPDPDAVEADWRLFLAVPLPEEVRSLVRSLVDDLKREGWPVRWVDPDAAHLTLHFLGEVPREEAELLRLALPPVVGRHAAFDLRTANLGVFPTLRRPRVLWLGLHGPAHRLESIQRDIGATLVDLGHPVEPGPFRAHVTLGRVRDQGTPQMPLRHLPEAVRRRLFDPTRNDFVAPPPRRFPVREVELVRSHLSHAGARYEAVARFPLAPPEAAAR